MRTRSQTGFAALTTEGAILPADLLRRISEGDASLGGFDPSAFHLPAGERLSEAISRAWSRLQGSWAAFKSARERLPEADAGTTLTRERWLLPLFQELGYGRLTPAKPITLGEKSYAISHGWQHAPLHLVSFRLDLDKRQQGAAGASKSSPHSLVQELLNRSDEYLWGFVTNGLRLRILRDNASLSRQAFVEFDLEAIFDGELYADFALLWLLCHQSRVESDGSEPCWLEKWSKAAKQQGTRALDRLRTGVEEAIAALGTGLLVHPANGRLRDRLQSGALDLQDLYRELLRHVYRLLFLFVAEDRGLLHPPGASAAPRERYTRFFSTQRLRQTALRLRGGRHSDLFASHRLVIGWLGSAVGQPELGLPALGSLLFSTGAVPETGSCEIANREFLAAVRALAFTVDAGVRRAVDYRNLGAEELGSVYESLLDLHPRVEVEAGRFELTHGGTERRATGSHYTPTPVTKTVLDFALDPAIAECLKQLDPEKALLSLRVLDPACGSGHFLIAAAQRIGRRLASIRTGDEEPAPEAIRQAVRDVVAHCIYGVDVNPMAVELCKVALWMETLEPGKPLGFLDHRIRCGDSLLGVPLTTTVARMKREMDERREQLTAEIATVDEAIRKAPFKGEDADRLGKKRKALEKELNSLEYDLWPDHVPDEAFKATAEDDKALVRGTVSDNRKERRSGQRSLFRGTLLDVTAAARVTEQLATAEESVSEVQAKSASLRELEASLSYRVAKLRADAWCAPFFWRIAADEPPAPTDTVFQMLKEAPDRLDFAMSGRIDHLASCHRFFHFELAFPEVFVGERPGFDVEVGNPPYLGGKRISTNLGDRYLRFLKVMTPESADTTDLSAYFFRRGFDLLRERGDLGFLATNTIAQGDTRAAALGPITTSWGGTIANAIRSMPWEGVANLEVAVVHLHRGEWTRARTLDGRGVVEVTPSLDDGSGGTEEPKRLAANAELAFIGSYVLGMGFVLTPEEAAELIGRNPRNREVLMPFLGGRELYDEPSQAPTRWVINFFDWPLDHETGPEDYAGPVAADFPDCLDIVRATVKPERDLVKRPQYRNRWWLYAERQPKLQRAIRSFNRVLVCTQTSETWAPVFVSTGTIFSHKTVVFVTDAEGPFACLQSAVHQIWRDSRGSTMRTDRVYTPTDCFGTFPFPLPTDTQLAQLTTVGAQYERHRSEVCRRRSLGLTKLYNLFHDPGTESDERSLSKTAPPFDDLRRLRALHAEIDRVVLDSYGWTDLNPRHGFYCGRDAGTGVANDDFRFTIHPEVRTEILRRLFALNHERATEEAARRDRGEEIQGAFAALSSDSD